MTPYPHPRRRRWLAMGLASATGMVVSLRTPGTARAQAGPAARVGWLKLNDSGTYAGVTERGFRAGLEQGGYAEGRNLTLVIRNARGDVRRLRALAREIVAEQVDVLFAPAKPMADAAWYASRKVPTVIATVTDPVLVDYAVSLARPGKHITGVTTANAELIGKRLQLAAEMVPGLARVGVPIDPDLLDSCEEEMRLMDAAARRLRMDLVRLNMPARATADPAALVGAVMQSAAQARVQLLMTAPMSSNLEFIDLFGAAAAQARMPFVHDVPQFADQGLAVYGPDFEDIFRRVAGYVVRILRGEKPAEMPIEEPRDFRLIVNQRQARQLGLVLSPQVLLRADRVIE